MGGTTSNVLLKGPSVPQRIAAAELLTACTARGAHTEVVGEQFWAPSWSAGWSLHTSWAVLLGWRSRLPVSGQQELSCRGRPSDPVRVAAVAATEAGYKHCSAAWRSAAQHTAGLQLLPAWLCAQLSQGSSAGTCQRLPVGQLEYLPFVACANSSDYIVALLTLAFLTSTATCF